MGIRLVLGSVKRIIGNLRFCYVAGEDYRFRWTLPSVKHVVLVLLFSFFSCQFVLLCKLDWMHLKCYTDGDFNWWQVFCKVISWSENEPKWHHLQRLSLKLLCWNSEGTKPRTHTIIHPTHIIFQQVQTKIKLQHFSSSPPLFSFPPLSFSN